MKNGNEIGFTLIELMAVVILIGILAAVTLPQLVEVNRRHRLDEATNVVSRLGAETRQRAMKTRRAVVLEIRRGHFWINQLDEESCVSTISERCVNPGSDAAVSGNTNEVRIDTPFFSNAGVSVCDLRTASIRDDGSGDTCGMTSIDLSTGIAVCYNGSGQMWIREAPDANTICTAASDPDTSLEWRKACVPWADPGNTAANSGFSGVDVRLNRFTSGAGTCAPGGTISADVEDVTRQVILPAGGQPFSRSVL